MSSRSWRKERTVKYVYYGSWQQEARVKENLKEVENKINEMIRGMQAGGSIDWINRQCWHKTYGVVSLDYNCTCKIDSQKPYLCAYVAVLHEDSFRNSQL